MSNIIVRIKLFCKINLNNYINYPIIIIQLINYHIIKFQKSTNL